MTIVEMCVDIESEGCERRIRKALLKLKGVEDVFVERVNQKVTVTGWADQKKILKTVRKTVKTAVLWPYPCNVDYYYDNYAHRHPTTHHDTHHREYHASTCTYSHASSSNSYNYGRKHNYDDSRVTHGYYYGYESQPVYSMQYIFSDDNPNACSVM